MPYTVVVYIDMVGEYMSLTINVEITDPCYSADLERTASIVYLEDSNGDKTYYDNPYAFEYEVGASPLEIHVFNYGLINT